MRTHPSVAARLARGGLSLHAWTYKFETGQVFGYDAATGQFIPIKEESNVAGVEQHRP